MSVTEAETNQNGGNADQVIKVKLMKKGKASPEQHEKWWERSVKSVRWKRDSSCALQSTGDALDEWCFCSTQAVKRYRGDQKLYKVGLGLCVTEGPHCSIQRGEDIHQQGKTFSRE